MNNDNFSYTYSASRQEEISKIREKYIPKEEDKLLKLRRLDRSVTQKAMAWSLSAGVIGTLILGIGMSMCMVLSVSFFIPGIIIGIIGIAALGCAYPLYNAVLEKERKRVAPEIIKLTDELSK